MNRNQRKYGRAPKKIDSETKDKKNKNVEVQEVVTSPKIRKDPANMEKLKANRSCFTSPNQVDFGQLTETNQYQDLLYEQYGFEPIIPDTIAQLKELKKVLCGHSDRVENSSQYVNPNRPVKKIPGFVETSDGAQWQSIEKVDDIDRYINIMSDKNTQKDSFQPCRSPLPSNVHISEVPRVKIIAKKFSRYKKDNIELRKLDEKVVCIEYDIFDQEDPTRPVQMMRAFFSIKPTTVCNENEDSLEKPAAVIPSAIKRNFNIADEDLKTLNEKEVEIIDGKIAENKPYLDDLKKILKRKANLTKNKNTLDLMSLYEMARREPSPLVNYSGANMLTKAELEQVKDLILAKCTSSMYGVSRRTVKGGNLDSKNESIGVISQSIVVELLREDAKTNVFE